MKHLYTLCAILLALNINAQLNVNSDIDPVEAVESFFLTNGVFVSNISFQGDSAQFGLFDCVDCNLGLTSGLVMATGDATLVEGPNEEPGTTLGGGNFGIVDADLELANPGFTTNDVAILEFDFIASGDSLVFEFVFGSEEYPEWINSAYNDAFGFFVSGPGIDGPYSNGAENISLVPGTSEIVGVNSINDTNNSQYYIDNSTLGSDVTQIGLDGFTVVLVAQIDGLTIGEEYHIKLAICDAGDTIIDSAVFLEASSFSLFCSETVDFAPQEDCQVSELDYGFYYTVDCGTVNFENYSEIGVDVTGCEWSMGDGTVYDACDTEMQHEFAEPGTYEVTMTYWSGDYYSTVSEEIVITNTPPETPIIDGLYLTNWDGVSSIQWYHEGSPIIGETSESTELIEWGEYYVIVSNGCGAVSNSIVVGVEEYASLPFELYPNPSNGLFTLSSDQRIARMQVRSVSGELVIDNANAQPRSQFEIANAGVYVLTIQLEDGSRLHHSLIVQ